MFSGLSRLWRQRCHHPAHLLRVRGDEHRAEVDIDFESVTYKLACTGCGEKVNLEFTRVTGGPAKFLQGSIDNMDMADSVVHTTLGAPQRFPGIHGS